MGVENIQERLRNIWLENAKNTIAINKSTFAILPISKILGDKSYLDFLEEEGYTINVPK